MATTLEDAVKSAVESEVTITETQATNKTETQKESTETKTETKEPTVEEVAQQQRTERALRLLDTLEDKDLGTAFVRTLAEKAGIIGAEQGKSTKEITQSVVEVLKESLGAEYEFLADKLAPAFDKIVKGVVQEQIKPLQVQTNEALEKAAKAEVDAVFEKFEANPAHKDFKKYENEMLELSKEMPFTGEYPMERYLERLYKIVTSDKKEANVIKKTVDKINKNAQEIRDSSTEVQENRVAKGSKLPSLNEAVAAAFRGERI